MFIQVIEQFAFFYIKTLSFDWRNDFAREVFSLIDPDKAPYLGVCFGKYSRVVDFYHNSAKIASFLLGTLSDIMSNMNLHFSASLILCKPITEVHFDKIKDYMIRSYTFLKPKSRDKFLTNLDEFLQQFPNKKVNSTIYNDVFLNNSSYPLITVTYGNNYTDVIERTRQIRMNSDWIIDSSSYITLRVDEVTKEAVEDDKTEVPAIIFLKTNSFPNIDQINFTSSDSGHLWPDSMERFGWYDVCDCLQFRSLNELYMYIKQLKTDSDLVGATSTLLLKKRTIGNNYEQ